MGPSPTPFVSTDATLFVVKPVLKTREGHTICALHDNPHTADNIVQTARKHKGNHAFRAVAVEHSMLPLSAMGATRMTCGTQPSRTRMGQSHSARQQAPLPSALPQPWAGNLGCIHIDSAHSVKLGLLTWPLREVNCSSISATNELKTM